jgi:hypothetical protein
MANDDYIPVPGHPLVKVDACRRADGYVQIFYIGDREPLLAAGVVPADELLLEPRPRRVGKGSRPRRSDPNEHFRVDAYWRGQAGAPVRRFRLFLVRTEAHALQLPGVREALEAEEREEAFDAQQRLLRQDDSEPHAIH